MSSRIEQLYIVTTKKGTNITNYAQDITDIKKDVYSIIEVIPDENNENIKLIKGVYNYGKKFDDKYRCTFSTPDLTSILNGKGSSLLSRLKYLFDDLLTSDSHNDMILKGIEYTGNTERQKFINAFVSGVSIILCVYDILGKSANTMYNTDSLDSSGNFSNGNFRSSVASNPFYPLNLCFPNINVDINLLNQNFYNYVSYYIYSSREKYGIQIRGLGLEWLEKINDFWKIFSVCFNDDELNESDNLIAMHASTLGFAVFFEERVYHAWNKMQETTSTGIEKLKTTTSSLLEEIKDTNDGYMSDLKRHNIDTEKNNKKYAEKLSQKFQDFNEVIDDVSEQYQIGLSEVKEELREFVKKNQDDLVKDIIETWEVQLNEMNEYKQGMIKTMKSIEKSSIDKIDQSSNSMINASITRLRSEVESLIDVVSNKKDGLLADLNKFEKQIKTQISLYTKKYRKEVSEMEIKMYKKNGVLVETIENKEKEQLEAAETLIDYITQSQQEINESSMGFMRDFRSTSESIVNDEIQSIINEKSKELIEESFNDNLDNIASIIKEKITESLDPAVRNTYKQINNSHRSIIDDINKKYNKLQDLTEYIDDKHKELEIKEKKLLELSEASDTKIKLDENIKLKNMESKLNKMEISYANLEEKYLKLYSILITDKINDDDSINVINSVDVNKINDDTVNKINRVDSINNINSDINSINNDEINNKVNSIDDINSNDDIFSDVNEYMEIEFIDEPPISIKSQNDSSDENYFNSYIDSEIDDMIKNYESASSESDISETD